MECYSAFKKKEILSLVSMWMNYMKDVMISKVSQTQNKYYMIPLIWEI